MPFQVVKYDSPTIRLTTAYSTLGLSDHPLRSRTSGRDLRLELIMMIRTTESQFEVPDLLQNVGLQMIQTGSALLRGDVIGPRGPLRPGSNLEALYAALPVYLADDFAGCSLGDGLECAIVWLIPISAKECAFVRSHGWPAFEAAMARDNPDLLAMDRDELRTA
jgi:hypothetical protein